MRVSVFPFGAAGRGRYGLEDYPSLSAEMPDDVFQQVDVRSSPTACLDDRLAGGLAGGSLTAALMMNFINWARNGGERGGSNLNYNLSQLHALGLPVWLHEDCAALANCLTAIRQMAATESNDMYQLGLLYGKLHGEAVELPASSWSKVGEWAASLPSGYVNDPQDVLSYVRALQFGQVAMPEGEHEASCLVYTHVYGRNLRFEGHHLIRDTMGGRPLVVNAHEAVALAAEMTDTPSLRRDAALLGRWFTLTVLSLMAAEHMPVVHVTQGS